MSRATSFLSVVWLLFGLAASAAELPVRSVTILANDQAIQVDKALLDGADLLIPTSDVPKVTGFEVKDEGICAGTVCYFPAEASWKVEQGGTKYFNLTKFANKIDQVFAVDEANQVWSFTPVPHPHSAPIITGMAPDFTLPNREGKPVKLSDFRGKKVLIVTWASWCGCRLDIAGWQSVYEDLKNKNFEIISVAEDTGGPAVAEPWFAQGKATYTCLIDVNHIVSSLYQMVNVPSGVWIDETGKIVRPSEVAYSKQMTFRPGSPSGDDRYGQGVRDWVEKGAKSQFLPSEESLKQRLALRAPELRLADAHFHLGTYFTNQGKKGLAATHYQQAQKLNPDNWNYHRQQWSFEPATANQKWSAKVRALDGKPYYDPVDFPATK